LYDPKGSAVTAAERKLPVNRVVLAGKPIAVIPPFKEIVPLFLKFQTPTDWLVNAPVRKFSNPLKIVSTLLPAFSCASVS
jgi:hypothetical protein